MLFKTLELSRARYIDLYLSRGILEQPAIGIGGVIIPVWLIFRVELRWCNQLYESEELQRLCTDLHGLESEKQTKILTEWKYVLQTSLLRTKPTALESANVSTLPMVFGYQLTWLHIVKGLGWQAIFPLSILKPNIRKGCWVTENRNLHSGQRVAYKAWYDISKINVTHWITGEYCTICVEKMQWFLLSLMTSTELLS